MDWFAAIDAYCERLGPEYWSEPINAITNLAFVLAAAVMGWRLRGTSLALGKLLAVLLALIGMGSYLFHTHAQAWSSAVDVGFILLFVLLYLFLASRDYLGLSPIWAAATVVMFFPFAAVTTPVLTNLPLLGISAPYLPIALLIAAYGIALLRNAPHTARGLLIGSSLLLVSITFRSLDMPLCQAIPMGTHFAWHILNAIMLGWMIEVYRRHMLAPPPHQG